MVYLIHIHGGFKHAKHYVGYCEDGKLAARLQRHRTGGGAKLLRACNAAGVAYDVVRAWPEADRTTERRLKARKEAAKFCPCCTKNPYKTIT